MRKVLLISVAFLSFTTLQAKSLGVVGSTFPVAEMSLLSLIESRVAEMSKSGRLEKINHDFIDRASFHADRPNPNYLSRSNTTKTHFYAPVVKLTQTLTDHRGQIMYPAGTTVNALERMPYYKPCWFFFNGDDKAQVAFVKKNMNQCETPKLILTQGSVGDAEKALNSVIYFDQKARIAKKIKLIHVPAVVKRDKSQLKITEYAIKENGDEI